mgnify:CR=1 FL=1
MLQVLHLECVKYTSDTAYSNYSRVDVVQAFSQHLALRLVYTRNKNCKKLLYINTMYVTL